MRDQKMKDRPMQTPSAFKKLEDQNPLPSREEPGEGQTNRRHLVPLLGCQATTRGFTVIEILVVVIIIVILAGLVVGAGAKMRQRALQEKTRTILHGAMAALTEYKAQNHHRRDPLEQVVDHRWIDADDMTVDAEDRIQLFVAEATQFDSVDRMLLSLGNDAYDGQSLFDAWGNELDYVAFVDHNDDVYDFDKHLPERGMKDAPKPYFASRGADGQWGDDNRPASTQPSEKAQDNLYSFDMD